MLTERHGGWPGRVWHELNWEEVAPPRFTRMEEARDRREAAMAAAREALAKRAKQEDADGDSQ